MQKRPSPDDNSGMFNEDDFNALVALLDEAERIRLTREGQARLSSARTKFLLGTTPGAAFFANCALRLTITPAWEFPTGATDGVRLLFNPYWVSKLSSGQVVGFLAHEVLHCVLRHGTRMPPAVQAEFRANSGGAIPDSGRI